MCVCVCVNSLPLLLLQLVVAALLSLQMQFGVLQLGRQPLRLLLQLLDAPLRLLVVGLQVADLRARTHTRWWLRRVTGGGGCWCCWRGLTLRSSCRLLCCSTSSLSSSSCCCLFLVNSISLMARSYFSRHSPPVAATRSPLRLRSFRNRAAAAAQSSQSPDQFARWSDSTRCLSAGGLTGRVAYLR